MARSPRSVKESSIFTHLIHQVVPEVQAQHLEMVTTPASSTLTVKPKILEKFDQVISAPHGVIKAFLLQPFHILESRFSAKAIHLLKHVMVAYATSSGKAVMASKFSPHQQPCRKAHEGIYIFASKNLNSAAFNTQASHCKGEDRVNSISESVHYKLSIKKAANKAAQTHSSKHGHSD